MADTKNFTAMIINNIAQNIHEQNEKWWVDINTGEALDRNFGEMIALAHSELSEALEGDRKNLMDNHLPDRKMAEVELADAVIRIFDIAAGLNMDIGGAMVEKLIYNKTRADHQTGARLAKGGKAY
jgi:hypothetical protein